MTTTTQGKDLAMESFARRLFTRGIEFFGSREVRQTCAPLAPKPDQIPPIPFTKEELERARELGQCLELHGPTTMRQLYNVFGNKLGKGKLLYNIDWYREDLFYTSEKSPDWHWRLTSKEVIPNSTKQDYLQQTRLLVGYLTHQVYAGQLFPEPYVKAIEELNRQEDTLVTLMAADWKQAAEALAKLQINRLCRETPAQVLWSIALHFKVNGQYLLPNMYAWTNARSAGGDLVGVGCADSGGVYVGHNYSTLSSDALGVRFSRRALPLAA